LNSQIVSINEAVRSKNTFYLLTSLIPVSLFFTSGFVSVSIIWFFALCLYNFASPLRDQFINYRILLFPIVLFALNVPWLFFTDDLPGATDLTLRKIHLLLIPFGLMVVNTKVSEKGLNVILALFLLACLIASVICLAVAAFNVIRHQSLVDYSIEPHGYYFTHYSLTRPVNITPVYLSMFCNFTFLIGLHSPYIHSQAKRVLSLYMAFFIIMIFSVIGIVTLMVIALFWSTRTRHRNLTPYAAAGIFAAGLIVFFYTLPFLQQQFTPEFREQPGDVVASMPARLAIWSSAWKTIEQNRVIGYGPAGGQKALAEVYEQQNFTWGIKEALNPHNQFLSTYMDLGLIGFCVLFGGLVYSLILSIRMKDRFATCFIILIFFFFCFESVLVRQKGIVFFSFFYSVVFSRLAARKHEILSS
jgi:O-antigen ligase